MITSTPTLEDVARLTRHLYRFAAWAAGTEILAVERHDHRLLPGGARRVAVKRGFLAEDGETITPRGHALFRLVEGVESADGYVSAAAFEPRKLTSTQRAKLTMDGVRFVSDELECTGHAYRTHAVCSPFDPECDEPRHGPRCGPGAAYLEAFGGSEHVDPHAYQIRPDAPVPTVWMRSPAGNSTAFDHRIIDTVATESAAPRTAQWRVGHVDKVGPIAFLADAGRVFGLAAALVFKGDDAAGPAAVFAG